ncbi:MAG: helix-turn-helix domain-containing protein [Alphaproteobacteria bacterium]
MDKRDIHELFRTRLREVLVRHGQSHAKFAATIGLDRSALSQLLSETATRLPRADTLQRIAGAHNVSLDWLLGLSQSDRLATEIAPTLKIEEASGADQETQLAEWHRETTGYKTRYVPAIIPDLLRTDAVIEYEHKAGRGARAETQIREAVRQLDFSRRPETDMEVCMPRQGLEIFAHGRGVWSGLSREVRSHQFDHILRLLEELYPTFRLFLYDGRQAFSAPYTVFGPLRAAIYMGEMYLVLNGTEQIQALTRHFDNLIRHAVVHPHEMASYVNGLRKEI